MKISALIVDDDPGKVGTLSTFLLQNQLDAADIQVASDARDARKQLLSRTFDLLLIDVLLPARPGESPSGETSVEFLKQLFEEQDVPVPPYIVAVTANREALDVYEDDFRKLTTLIVEVSVSSKDWPTSLIGAIAHIRASKNQQNAFDVDVCILTALRNPELKAAQDAIPIDWGSEELFVRGSTCRKGEYKDKQKTLRIVCAHSNLMGMVPCTHTASQLIKTFRPRVLAMTGVCAGMASDIRIGDVVVATKSWDWQSGKWDGRGSFRMAPEQVNASSQLLSLALASEQSIESFYTSYTGIKPSHVPRLRSGPMMTGSSVIAYEKLKLDLLRQHRKTEALDMECYGLYYAANHASDPVPETICIKSVCDLADARKKTKYQPFCSYISAAILWETLLRVPAALFR